MEPGGRPRLAKKSSSLSEEEAWEVMFHPSCYLHSQGELYVGVKIMQVAGTSSLFSTNGSVDKNKRAAIESRNASSHSEIFHARRGDIRGEGDELTSTVASWT